MSLNWSVVDCENYQALMTEGEWYKTESIALATMAIDMDSITKENLSEFYARLTVISELSEGLWYSAGKGWEMPTFLDVEKRIGLTTNAFSRNTRNQWLKRMIMVHKDTVPNTDELLATFHAAKAHAERMSNGKVGS